MKPHEGKEVMNSSTSIKEIEFEIQTLPTILNNFHFSQGLPKIREEENPADFCNEPSISLTSTTQQGHFFFHKGKLKSKLSLQTR